MEGKLIPAGVDQARIEESNGLAFTHVHTFPHVRAENGFPACALPPRSTLDAFFNCTCS